MLKKSFVLRRRPLKMKLPKADYSLLIFLSMIICGLIIGICVIKNGGSGLTDNIEKLLNAYHSAVFSESIFKSFCGSFFIILLIPVALFLCGLSAVGIPGIVILTVSEGLSLGSILAYYYTAFGFTGLGYAVLVIIPAAAVLIAVTVKFTSAGTKLSLYLFSTLVNASGEIKNDKALQMYCKDFGVKILPLIAAAAVQSISFRLFSGLFSFI